MLALDSSFNERDYGCASFRAFLARFPGRVRRAGRSGSDITLELIREHDTAQVPQAGRQDAVADRPPRR